MMKVNGKNIELSNTDKVFFRKNNITKGDLINYYKKISSIMIFHIEDRPLTLHRFPNGIDNDGFYQKEIPDYFPSWIDRVSVEKREGGETTYVVCNNKETLVYLADQGCITPHIWLSKTSDLEKPDKIIFDLDPASDDYSLIVKAANEIKKLLDSNNINSYLMTTGSRGVHIVIPIVPEINFDEARNYAKKIAEAVVEKNPNDFTVQHRKNKRKGRVFIDYLRNSYGQTSVVPYSIRSLEGAPIATPLDWEELEFNDFNPRKYNIKNIFRRLGQKEDPWKDMYSKNSSLTKIKDLLSPS